MPHEISSSAQFVSAFSSVYWRFASVQLAALRAASAAGRYASPSGNQIPISRSADSGESEPCTRFDGIASA